MSERPDELVFPSDVVLVKLGKEIVAVELPVIEETTRWESRINALLEGANTCATNAEFFRRCADLLAELSPGCAEQAKRATPRQAVAAIREVLKELVPFDEVLRMREVVPKEVQAAVAAQSRNGTKSHSDSPDS